MNRQEAAMGQRAKGLFIPAICVVFLGCGAGELTLGGGDDELGEGTARLLGGSPLASHEYPGTGFIIAPGYGPGRACSAVRIAADIGLTAGHCMDGDPDGFRFGWGDHTLKAESRPVVRLERLAPYDLTVFQLGGCGLPRPAQVADHHGLDDGYTLVSYLHENNTRDGARRKVDGVRLVSVNPSYPRLSATFACASASVWGGDSGSPLYDTASPFADARSASLTEVVGVATSVSGFCQNGATTQTVHFVHLASPLIRSRIEAKLDEWVSAADADCAQR
jgi:hypothetical protein